MPALIPVDHTLGALFVGTVLSSIIYGVTWLQVYSYYNGHCSRDRWPLKSFVAFLMLVDSANVVFISCEIYHIGVTNFGDYRSNQFITWSLPATALSGIVVELSVQHFYAYRIHRLRGGSLYLPAAISAISVTAFGLGVVFCSKILQHRHEPGSHFQDIFMAALACTVPCDALITVGMVYTLLSRRTQVRKTNNVLNLLALYAINCGILNLIFAISAASLLAKYRDTLIHTPFVLIMIRLYFCAFMSILNSRDNLREALDGPDGVAASLNQLKVHAVTAHPWGRQDTVGARTNTAVLPPVLVSSETFSDGVITLDTDTGKYPAPPVAEVFKLSV